MKSLRSSLPFARTKRAVCAAFALALTLAAALPCAAATLTVNSTADDGPGTLRQALADANEGDTIEFDVPLPNTIALTSGQLVVDKSVTITGPGKDLLTVDGQHLSRVFSVGTEFSPESLEVAISHLTIANGNARPDGFFGGGVANEGELTLSDCTLTGNEASAGGAIASFGTLTVQDCALSNNTAFGFTWYDDDPLYGSGGAIFMVSWDSEGPALTLTLDRCTLSGNVASGAEDIDLAYGGGIFVSAILAPVAVTVSDSTLVGNVATGRLGAAGGAIAGGEVNDYEIGADVIIRNSTLAGNSAVSEYGFGQGSAITNFKGSLTIDNSTLAGNFDDWDEADFEGPAGAIITLLGSLTIRNTILANDLSAMNLLTLSDTGDLLPIDDLGFNLCTDDCSGLMDPLQNLLNTDPILGPLADNDGPTLTHALLAGSPAIDAAAETDSAGNPVAFDQRGVARPQGSANDIGAVEVVQLTANDPPTADPGGPYLAAVNTGFAVDGSASSDPDGDSLNYSWEFDSATLTGESPSFVAPAEPGIYPLALTVDDGQGGGDTASTSVVVYDASAGFVTGGGWIASPAGAYFADPGLAGKATFGFVSKYRKGATVPTGNTAFEFAAGDLHLSSTSYEWLVVTGRDYARFKGSGTINGMGDYKFMVWAGDDEPDTFRIRIWQEDEASGVETDIYDNGFDQLIGGGSIVIHTK